MRRLWAMKIAITGAAGLIGSHLARYFACGNEVLPLKYSDPDMTYPPPH